MNHVRLASFATALICALPVSSSGQVAEIHSEHFFYGYPTGTPPTNDLIIRDLYALSHNDDRKFADWVAYRLTAAEVVGSLDLARDWREDPWLAEDERLEAGGSNDDYRGAHAAEDYDRGHLAPLASFKASPKASQVNYYSNIVPQKGDMNQGPWQRLEQAERDLVCAGSVLWVMTGTLHEGPVPPSLPNADEPHEVPSGFWKVLARDESNGIWVAALIFQQDTERNAEVVDHLVSVDEVESRSGLDLFRELEDAEEAAIEEQVMTASDWLAAQSDGACNRATVRP